MPESVENCLLCNNAKSKPFDSRTFAGKVVENQICRSCGFVFQSPRMTSQEADAFYTSEYRNLYQGSSGPNPKDLRMQQLRAESLAVYAGRQIKQISRHLDIGCSAGSLMQSMSHMFHCETVGIEPGETYSQYARESGLKIYASLHEIQAADEEKFDLVTMSHVLEHLPDPRAYLELLKEEILTSNGCLLIEVPNIYAHDSFEIAHLSSFSIHTLRQLVRKAGYEMIAYHKHGYPRSSVIPYFLTALCCPSPLLIQNKVKPERFVSIKRNLGLFRRRVISRLFPALAWKPLDVEKDQVPRS